MKHLVVLEANALLVKEHYSVKEMSISPYQGYLVKLGNDLLDKKIRSEYTFNLYDSENNEVIELTDCGVPNTITHTSIVDINRQTNKILIDSGLFRKSCSIWYTPTEDGLKVIGSKHDGSEFSTNFKVNFIKM